MMACVCAHKNFFLIKFRTIHFFISQRIAKSIYLVRVLLIVLAKFSDLSDFFFL